MSNVWIIKDKKLSLIKQDSDKMLCIFDTYSDAKRYFDSVEKNARDASEIVESSFSVEEIPTKTNKGK